MKNYSKIFLFILVTLFSVLMMYHFVFYKLSKYIEVAIGSFIAIFTTAAIAALAYLLKKEYERIISNYDILVELEEILNMYLNILHDNNTIIINGLKALESGIIFYVFNFKLLKSHNRIHHQLLNIDLKNDIFKLEVDYYRYNESLRTIIMMKKDLKDLIIANRLSGDTFKKNLEGFKENLEEMLKFSKSLEEKTKCNLSKVRVFCKSKRPLTVKFIKEKYKKKHLDLFKKENEKLNEEINNISKKSAEELKRIGLKSKE